MDTEKAEVALPAKPDDRLTITYDGKERELFMSFLRLNSMIRIVEDPTRVIAVTIDPDLGENCLRVLLAEKGGPGGMFDFELDENALSGEDVEKVLLWTQDHLTHFFMRRFQQVGAKAAMLEPLARALQSQAAGSVTSTSETLSAGPSA